MRNTIINGSSLQKNNESSNSEKKSIMRVSMLQLNNPMQINSNNFASLKPELNPNFKQDFS
jgi:hypothetical protein